MIKNIIKSAKKEYFNFKFKHFDNDFFDKVEHNNLNEVKALLDKGVDVNFQDKNLDTALHIAAVNNLPHMVNFLLDKGANPNTSNLNYDTPLLLICAKYQSPPFGERYSEEWHSDVTRRVSPIIQPLLKAGADPEAKNKQHDLPLVLAVRKNYDQGVRHLIASGANPLERDGNSVCGLGAALSFKKMATVEHIYLHAKDVKQLDGFKEINSLYLGTKDDFLPLLEKMKLKLSLDNKLPERKISHKIGKI
jgi:ankyrin repeat protein